MTTQEERKLITEQRQHEEHIQQTMDARTQAAPVDVTLQEESRELNKENLQHLEHLDQTMLTRREEEVGISQ